MNLITLVHKNGIVNQFKITDNEKMPENDTLVQVIWNGQIHGTIVGLNEEPTKHSDFANTWLIKDYRAIYLNGVMIVKGGKVWPRKRWFGV
jgi:hypothetical protein